MTTEPTTAPPAGESAPVPPAGAAPSLDIAALLADEAAADTPIKVSDLKPFLERQTGEIVAKVTTDLREQQQRADAQRRSQEEQQATAQADRTFARDIERRLREGSDEDRSAATQDMNTHRERYLRGLAVDYQAESAETRNRAIAEHVNPLFQQIKDDGRFQSYLDALQDPAQLQPHNGNWVLMALRHGEQAGYERGKAEAEAAADQTLRINTAAGGPPPLGTPANNDQHADLWEGIDRTKPGAASEYNNRVRNMRAQQGARR